MTDKELIELARVNNYPEEHMDLLVQWGRRVLMARRQFDLELQTMNIRAAVIKERKELEQELLKLSKGVASTSDYIQGRWDLIGEFQDAIRARGNNDKPV